MAESYQNIEESIQEAIEFHDTCENPNIAQIARNYAVPYQRLRARITGRPSRSERRPVNKYLSEAAENALCQFIQGLDKMCLNATLPLIAGAAFELRKLQVLDSNTPPSPPNKH